MDKELAELPTAPDPHKAVYKLGLKAGSLIAGRCLERDTAEAKIEAAAVTVIDPKQIKRIRRHIRRGIENGLETPRAPNTDEHSFVPLGTFATQILDAAKARGVEFKGIRGGTAWAICAALCTIAERAGKHHDPVEATWRQLGELARIGTVNDTHYATQPISRALTYLVEQGVIERLVRGRARQPSVWRVLLPHTVTPQTSTVASSVALGSSANRFVESVCAVAVSHHVVWDRVGLGVSAQRVHQALAGRGRLTVAEIAKVSGLSTQGVRNTCKRLAKHGMVEQDTEGRWPRWYWVGRSLDEVAAELGIEGRDAQRKHAHLEQRITFAVDQLTQLAEDRSIDPETGEIIT